MSVNLMETIKGAIPKQVMQQMGGMLGTDEAKTSSAFESITGSILGGMMKKAQTDDGAREVYDMVSKQDDGILDKLGDLMGGGDDAQAQSQGGGILEGIMGGSSQQSSIVGMIAKALGMDEGMIGKLLTMVAPVVLGAIGRFVKGSGMDASGLKNLLSSQGPNIANSMPAGLSDQMGLGNLMSNVTSAPPKMPAPSQAMNEAGGMGALKFVIPLLLLVALILAGVFVLPSLMGGGAGSTVVNASNIEDMEEDVVSRLNELAESIKGIKDTEEAEKVKTQIDALKDYIGGMKFRGVSAEDMQGIKGRMDMRALKVPLDEHAYKVDGVRDILDASVKALALKIEEVRALER